MRQHRRDGRAVRHLEANPAAQYNGFIGGNPDLQPEEADTISFGIELHPDFAPGLRVNLDWYSIKIDEPIQNPNAGPHAADLCA